MQEQMANTYPILFSGNVKRESIRNIGFRVDMIIINFIGCFTYIRSVSLIRKEHMIVCK